MHTPSALKVAAVILAAGATLTSAPPHPHGVMTSGTAAVVQNRPIASFVSTFDGSVASLNWTQVVAGIDGIGAGNDVFRVAVTVNASTICYMDIACDATAPQDFDTSCSSAFVSGDDIEVKITSAPCLGQATGFISLDLLQ